MINDMQAPLSNDEYRRRQKEFKSKGAFGSIWNGDSIESAYSAHKYKVAKIAMSRMNKSLKIIRGNVMENLREMGKILLVDKIASEQESAYCDGIETIWDKIDSANVSGKDLMDTVPGALTKHRVTMDAAIESLIPEMTRIVAAVDKAWDGKLTLAQLEKIGGDKVYTSTALQAAGHGVSIEDDPDIYDLLRKLRLKVPNVYLDEGALDDAIYIIESELMNALG